ncbi:hypothetical protein K438DRAFT_1762730 [Mycena galopus ATCC 62051]|nr:hypothetical protein K438DRAFT_1762730 [Mycena galopus ATCC 62051]
MQGIAVRNVHGVAQAAKCVQGAHFSGPTGPCGVEQGVEAETNLNLEKTSVPAQYLCPKAPKVNADDDMGNMFNNSPGMQCWPKSEASQAALLLSNELYVIQILKRHWSWRESTFCRIAGDKGQPDKRDCERAQVKPKRGRETRLLGVARDILGASEVFWIEQSRFTEHTSDTVFPFASIYTKDTTTSMNFIAHRGVELRIETSAKDPISLYDSVVDGHTITAVAKVEEDKCYVARWRTTDNAMNLQCELFVSDSDGKATRAMYFCMEEGVTSALGQCVRMAVLVPIGWGVPGIPDLRSLESEKSFLSSELTYLIQLTVHNEVIRLPE